MIRKLMVSAALAGMAFLVVPTSVSAQGTMQQGAGAGTAQGPVVQPGAPGAMRTGHTMRRHHAKRTRHMRSTVGSSSRSNSTR